MGFATLLFAFVIVPLALGAYLFIQGRGNRFELALTALMPLAIGIVLWSACYAIAVAPVFDWNAGKIAPVVAMVRGEPRNYALYQPPDTGVMTGWIYGPIPALVYLPAAMFSRPTDVIIAGVAINALLIAIAVFVLCWRVTRRVAWSIVLTASVIAWCLAHESLRRAVFMIAPDGPAIAFATLSCAMLIGKRSTHELVLAAIFMTLACWSKQTMLPAVIVAPIYLALSDGRRAAMRYAIIFLIVFATISTALVASFGPSNMYFHMVTLPRSHSWQTSLGRGVLDLLIDCAVPLIALSVARRTVLMLPMMALALIPSSILGYVKVGGFINNFALTHMFIVLAVVGAAARHRVIRAAVCVALVVYAMNVALVQQHLPAMASRIANPSANAQEVAYRYAKAHPGVAYFPWNNLSSLLAEGRLYHFEWGIRDRYDAKMWPSPEQIIAHLPPRVRIIGFPVEAQSEFARNLFPLATEQISNDELPNFVVYTAP